MRPKVLFLEYDSGIIYAAMFCATFSPNRKQMPHRRPQSHGRQKWDRPQSLKFPLPLLMSLDLRRFRTKFETAYMTWTRLVNDDPMDVVHHRALISLAFEGVALRAFEELAAVNPTATSEELWTLVRQRLCNESQIISLRTSFMNMKLNWKKESRQAYATRLRSTSINLHLGRYNGQ